MPTVILLLAGVALLVALSSARGGVAQGVTPAASPEATPVGGRPCSEVLGVGSPGDACVDIVHAALGIGAVDVVLPSVEAATRLEYGTTSDFLAVAAGDAATVTVTSAGDPETVVAEADLRLRAGEASLLLVSGVFGTDSIGVTVVPIDLSPLLEETTRVLVVNAAPDVAELEIVERGDQTVLGEAAYPSASSPRELPVGSYALEVLGPDGEVLLEPDRTGFEADIVYALVVLGLVADGGLDLLVESAPAATAAGATPAAPPASPAPPTP